MKWRVGFLTVVVVFYAVAYAFGWVINRPRPLPQNPLNAPTPVLVAKQFIPKGTPGSLMARQEMYVLTALPRKEVEEDAISDPAWQSGLAADLDIFPAYLKGRAAAVDILPRQQLTETDFASASP